MEGLHIFRAGCHPAMTGDVCISAPEVTDAAVIYDPAVFQAPLVLGHPASNAPSFGAVSRLQAAGGNLFAVVEQVADVLKSAVGAGRYKKVSSSFFGPDHPDNPRPGHWYLRHVGFLGAAAPAVKGLAPVSLGDACATVELSIDDALATDFQCPQGFCAERKGLILRNRAQALQDRYPTVTFLTALQAVVAGDEGARQWDQGQSPYFADFAGRDAYVDFCQNQVLGIDPK